MGGGSPLKPTDWQCVAKSLHLPKDTPPYRIQEIIGEDSPNNILLQKLARKNGKDAVNRKEILDGLTKKACFPAPGLGDRN